MQLNQLKPKAGAKFSRKRVGRGIGSGLGKTCGKGHKGQKARAGGFHKPGFEGGQMPLQRRLPKFGFRSRSAKYHAQIRLTELNRLTEALVDFATLRAKGIIGPLVKQVKVIKDGDMTRALAIKGLKVSSGAKATIMAAGGKVED